MHKKFWFDADAQAVRMEKCVKIVPTSAVIWVHVWMVHLVQRVSTLLPSAHVLIIVRVSSLSTSVQNQTNGCVIVNYKTKNAFLFIAWKFAIKWERPIFIAWKFEIKWERLISLPENLKLDARDWCCLEIMLWWLFLFVDYRGIGCQLMVNHCADANICENGGTCVNLAPGFRCDCPPGRQHCTNVNHVYEQMF